jgi:hypothetical protein
MTNDLRKLVSEINQYLDAIDPLWREAAKRLLHITDNNLWNKEYKTYEEFVRKEWGKSKRWAYQLISSERAAQQLEENCKATSAQLCTNYLTENSARAYSSVPQELRVEVAAHIAHAHKPITAKAIQEAEVVVRKKEKPVVECDAIGYPIPPGHALDTWHRKQEAQDILTQLERLKSAIKKAQQDGDMFYLSEMEYQYVVARLDQLHYEFTKSKPYAVCLFCQGKLDKCEECNGRGMVSSVYWSREQHPDLPKYRDMRLKEIERLTQKDKHGHTAGLPTARL